MSRPWMPLYIADYLADTSHLTTVQHGAYLLLIMHYWKRGSLPEGDEQLAAITRMTAADWKKAKPIVQAFFSDGWKHLRIEKELAETKAIQEANSEKARGAANARWGKPDAPSNAPSIASSTDQAMLQNAHSHSPSQLHLQTKSSFSRIGDVKKGWTPPKHGATGKGRVYIEANTIDWQAYADDYRSVHKRDPMPNQHGGKWFKVLGEGADAPEKTWAQRQIEAVENPPATPAMTMRAI